MGAGAAVGKTRDKITLSASSTGATLLTLERGGSNFTLFYHSTAVSQMQAQKGMLEGGKHGKNM